jgi:D-alanyl-D-alanine carboxypeptidase
VTASLPFDPDQDLIVPISSSYEERVRVALAALGIPVELVRARGLPLCVEAKTLVVAEIDARGREQRLAPAAASAWSTMKVAAARAGVELYLVSAFRSFDRQCEIVRDKLTVGQSLEQILAVSAPPGYSEHHTGRAVDIGSKPDDSLEEAFEESAAYAWLSLHASRYGYFLSYPKGNRYGYRYEPWHWMHREASSR